MYEYKYFKLHICKKILIGATSLPLLDRRVNNVTSNLINLGVLVNNKITVKVSQIFILQILQ